MESYPIQLEISGSTAMWTRPDTGSLPVSYVAPTFSAKNDIFEAVLRWKLVKPPLARRGADWNKPIPSKQSTLPSSWQDQVS